MDDQDSGQLVFLLHLSVWKFPEKSSRTERKKIIRSFLFSPFHSISPHPQKCFLFDSGKNLTPARSYELFFLIEILFAEQRKLSFVILLSLKLLITTLLLYRIFRHFVLKVRMNNTDGQSDQENQLEIMRGLVRRFYALILNSSSLAWKNIYSQSDVSRSFIIFYAILEVKKSF